MYCVFRLCQINYYHTIPYHISVNIVCSLEKKCYNCAYGAGLVGSNDACKTPALTDLDIQVDCTENCYVSIVKLCYMRSRG